MDLLPVENRFDTDELALRFVICTWCTQVFFACFWCDEGDRYCSRSCADAAGQQRTIEKYNEAKERFDKGQVADADKDKLKDTVRALKEDLDQRKDQARRNTSLAETCVARREDVQKWFEEKAIPLTERARRGAARAQGSARQARRRAEEGARGQGQARR